MFNSKLNKLKRLLRSKVLTAIANTALQFKLYRAYWHYTAFKSSVKVSKSQKGALSYLTQQPNYGAGIGHQLANWNSGFYFAERFGLKYAYSPFSVSKWDSFLGFGEGEVSVSELERSGKFKIVRLPRFDSESPEEVKLIEAIISSYSSSDTLFKLELDQGYMRQCDTAEALSRKFFSATAREQDKLIYDKNKFNIAIHIRRGDIVIKDTDAVNPNLQQRWLDNDYYVKILNQVLIATKEAKKDVAIYLFSQGTEDDFLEFKNFDDLNFCLDMGAVDSFLHMIYADLLISSKSSFSYKPALISKGIQIYPNTFWHEYPESGRYIPADYKGEFEMSLLVRNFQVKRKL